jgi:hypothetical protein
MDNYDKFNKRIKMKIESPYKIHVEYEHGDADLTTTETFKYKNETDFVNAAKFFYECFNFKPNTAYSNMGYFYPIPAESLNGVSTEDEAWEKCVEIGKKYNISENEISQYIERDKHYHHGFANLEGIKATVNGEEKVFVFKKALETNKIDLPKIGDIVTIKVNEIPGLGDKIFGGKWKDYLPNSGKKDYLVSTFKAKVLNCSINFFHDDYTNKYYHSYTYFDYIILVETLDNVLKINTNDIRKGVFSMKGYDPDFEVKFDKDKYDGMNYFEID